MPKGRLVLFVAWFIGFIAGTCVLSAQVSGNGVRTGDSNAVTTAMIVNNNVTRDKVEVELRTRNKCFILDGTIADTDDIAPGWPVQTYPVTVTKITCKTSSGTVTANIQRDDGSPADIATSDLVCDNPGGGETTTSFAAAEDNWAAGDWITLDIVSVSSPTDLSFCFEYTID